MEFLNGSLPERKYPVRQHKTAHGSLIPSHYHLTEENSRFHRLSVYCNFSIWHVILTKSWRILRRKPTLDETMHFNAFETENESKSPVNIQLYTRLYRRSLKEIIENW